MKHLRILENFHIVLWLIKDMCWLIHFKIGGVLMVIPTIYLAVHLSYRTRKNPALFLPNLAVTCWIIANGNWMLGEFFDFNHVPVSFIFFGCGIALIAWYFFAYRHHEQQSQDV